MGLSLAVERHGQPAPVAQRPAKLGGLVERGESGPGVARHEIRLRQQGEGPGLQIPVAGLARQSAGLPVQGARRLRISKPFPRPAQRAERRDLPPAVPGLAPQHEGLLEVGGGAGRLAKTQIGGAAVVERPPFPPLLSQPAGEVQGLLVQKQSVAHLAHPGEDGREVVEDLHLSLALPRRARGREGRLVLRPGAQRLPQQVPDPRQVGPHDRFGVGSLHLPQPVDGVLVAGHRRPPLPPGVADETDVGERDRLAVGVPPGALDVERPAELLQRLVGLTEAPADQPDRRQGVSGAGLVVRRLFERQSRLVERQRLPVLPQRPVSLPRHVEGPRHLSPQPQLPKLRRHHRRQLDKLPLRFAVAALAQAAHLREERLRFDPRRVRQLLDPDEIPPRWDARLERGHLDLPLAAGLGGKEKALPRLALARLVRGAEAPAVGSPGVERDVDPFLIDGDQKGAARGLDGPEVAPSRRQLALHGGSGCERRRPRRARDKDGEDEEDGSAAPAHRA